MKNLNKGAFFLARKIFNSEIWLEKPSSWKVIWTYILGNVSHKKNGKFDRGEGFFNFSRELKNIGPDITYDMIRAFLRYAKSVLMLNTKRTTRGTIIKVLKYNEYQTLDNYSNTTENTIPTTSQTQQKHNDIEECKELKKKEIYENATPAGRSTDRRVADISQENPTTNERGKNGHSTRAPQKNVEKKDAKKRKEESIKKLVKKYSTPAGGFNSGQYITDLINAENNPNDKNPRRTKIIGLYFALKERDFKSAKVAYDDFMRNIVPASVITEYSDDEIDDFGVWVENQPWIKPETWTMETMVKWMAEGRHR